MWAVAVASLVFVVGCSGSDHPAATPASTTSLFPELSDFSIEASHERSGQEAHADLTPRATVSPVGTPVIAPGVSDHLPRTPLPDGFFIPGAGDANFDVYTRVIAQSGDWLLATQATSAYPIPSGWTTLNSLIEESMLLFDRDGVEVDGYAIKSTEVVVQISRMFQRGTTAIEEILNSHESRMGNDPDVTVLARKSYGGDRGYLLVRAKGWDGVEGYGLLFLTHRSHPSGDGFDSLVAFWPEDAADEYYSIVRTIVGGWVDLENRVLGAELPETLPAH